MTPDSRQPDMPPAEMLDAYLDDRLADDDRRRFELALDTDTALRRQLDLQRAIDASLARTLAPPSNDAMAAIMARARGARDAGRSNGAATVMPRPAAAPPAVSSPLRRLALAASIALLVSGAWMIWSIVGASGPAPYESLPQRAMHAVYADQVAGGLVPDVVCDGGDEFERWFVQHLRRPLRLADPLPAGVEALGLGYCHTLSPATMYLLARVDGKPVVVFVDRTTHAVGDADHAPGPAPEGLHRHERIVGDLVLYELSPFAAPRVLPQLYDPEGDAGGGS